MKIIDEKHSANGITQLPLKEDEAKATPIQRHTCCIHTCEEKNGSNAYKKNSCITFIFFGRRASAFYLTPLFIEDVYLQNGNGHHAKLYYVQSPNQGTPPV